MSGHYGETLRSLRQQKGLSRAALARRLAIPGALLAEIEATASRPSEPLVARLCGELSITPDLLDASAGFLPTWVHDAIRSNARACLSAIASIRADWTPSKTPRRHIHRRPVLTTPLGALYREDCMDLLARVENDSVDLVFADPPFNLDKDYGLDVDDSLADGQYLDWCKGWLTEIVRILKPGASFFLYNLPKWNVRLASWLCQYLEFRHWIAVDIKFSLPIPGRLYPSHYSLLYFTKGAKPSRFHPPRVPIETCRHCGGELRDYGGYKDRMNPAGVNITDVWTDLAPVRHGRFKRRKANELPLKMLDRILDIASSEGDLVLDPFGGSGTTYVAAELKNRRWVGCEIGDCQPIVRRFKMLEQDRRLLDGVRARLNVLFTADALRLRQKFGHKTSKYRLAGNGDGHSSRPQQPNLFD